MTQKQFSTMTWLLVLLSVLLPLYVWGDSIGWNFSGLTLYQYFPLFGLLAWMVMWTHYVSGAVRVKTRSLSKPANFGAITGVLVLGALLLHPGLLALAQFQNGAGAPPASFYSYVGDALRLSVMLGSISLLIFLSFEIFSRLKNRQTIKKYWKYIGLSQAVAMSFIFIHGLSLGSQIQSGWFIYIWYLYGIILVPCLYIIIQNDFKDTEKSTSVV
jgi:hypothetical protein